MGLIVDAVYYRGRRIDRDYSLFVSLLIAPNLLQILKAVSWLLPPTGCHLRLIPSLPQGLRS